MRKRYSASTKCTQVSHSKTHLREILTDGIAAAEGQYDGLNRESHWKKIYGTGKRLLEIDDFCSRSVGEVGGVLEIYR